MDTQLTQEQVTSLVTYLIEDHGKSLSRDRFSEVLLLSFEEIAGLNSTQVNSGFIDNAYAIYLQQIFEE